MINVHFAALIVTLRNRVPFSVVSWIRSPEYNKAVGGVENSYHLTGKAVDIILDDRRLQGALEVECERLGLEVIDEVAHIHIEPKGG